MAGELGSRIRALREARGCTRIQLAWAADVPRTWLSRLERGYIPHPDRAALGRLAAALGVAVEDLLAGEPPGQAAVPSAAAAAANRATIEDLVTEVVNHGNLAVADHALAETYVIHGPFPDVTVNRDQVKQAIVRLRRAFPDLNVTIDDLVADAERVVVRWTLTGTHSGTVAGVAPTGTNVTHAGIAIFGMAGGKVVESWMLADATDRALLARLGLFPARPGTATEG